MAIGKQFKVFSMGVGLAAVALFAVLGVMSARPSAQTQDWTAGSMETGQTVTQSAPGSAPATSMARPAFTFTTPEGFAVPH